MELGKSHPMDSIQVVVEITLHYLIHLQKISFMKQMLHLEIQKEQLH